MLYYEPLEDSLNNTGRFLIVRLGHSVDLGPLYGAFCMSLDGLSYLVECLFWEIKLLILSREKKKKVQGREQEKKYNVKNTTLCRSRYITFMEIAVNRKKGEAKDD